MSDVNIGGENMHAYRVGRGEFGPPLGALSEPVTDESRVRRLVATLGRSDDLAFDLVRITLKAVRDDEREACAQLCESKQAISVAAWKEEARKPGSGAVPYGTRAIAFEEAAKAIRMRGVS